MAGQRIHGTLRVDVEDTAEGWGVIVSGTDPVAYNSAVQLPAIANGELIGFDSLIYADFDQYFANSASVATYRYERRVQRPRMKGLRPPALQSEPE